MRVLVACEFSGIVRDAFAARGHDAWSCDLLPSERNGQHIQADVRYVMWQAHWDLMIGHPPCTFLTRAGAAYYRHSERKQKRELAIEFFKRLWRAPIDKIAIENPLPFNDLIDAVGPYHQRVNPFEFGEEERKAVCLWLKNLPPLFASEICTVKPKAIYTRKTGAKAGQKYRAYYHNGKNAHERSRFFPGIAAAMAAQWG